jgi:hypothetical protein
VASDSTTVSKRLRLFRPYETQHNHIPLSTQVPFWFYVSAFGKVTSLKKPFLVAVIYGHKREVLEKMVRKAVKAAAIKNRRDEKEERREGQQANK